MRRDMLLLVVVDFGFNLAVDFGLEVGAGVDSRELEDVQPILVMSV